MKVFIVNLKCKPECRDEFIALTKHNAENSVKEEGNVRFDFLMDEYDPCSFKLYEVWKDDAAIDAHRDAPHYQKWAAEVGEMLAEKRSKTVAAPVFFTE